MEVVSKGLGDENVEMLDLLLDLNLSGNLRLSQKGGGETDDITGHYQLRIWSTSGFPAGQRELQKL